jgi:pyruvate dehydrogenase E2 component (dihydrolipoamide acetyltransferase)
MTTTTEVRVPDIGDLSDVPIIEILVAPGDVIKADDPLVVIESDKATLEIPADMGGRVISINVAENDTVSRGSVIASIETCESATGDIQTAALPTTATHTDSELPVAAAQQHSVTPAREKTVATDQYKAGGKDTLIYASPSVRKLARELGVPIADVSGSGPKHRIGKSDVKQFVKLQLSGGNGSGASQLTATLAAFPAWPSVDHEQFGPTERTDLNRIARISGPALARNAILIPHVTYFDKTDITDTESFRQQLNREATDEDAKITLLSFAVKAVVSALKAHPVFNASLEGQQLVIKKYWNIGVAVDTPNGLLVPVLKAADKKGVRQIGNEMAQLAEAARGGALAASDMQGATFTISSLGSIGGTNFTPIINAPEVAILGLPRSEIQPVWDGEQFTPRRIQPLSMSFDHRVADGAEAARFMSTVCDGLNDFRRTAV